MWRWENKELREKDGSQEQEELNIEQTLQKKKISHEQTLKRIRQVRDYSYTPIFTCRLLLGDRHQKAASGARRERGGGGGRVAN